MYPEGSSEETAAILKSTARKFYASSVNASYTASGIFGGGRNLRTDPQQPAEGTGDVSGDLQVRLKQTEQVIRSLKSQLSKVQNVRSQISRALSMARQSKGRAVSEGA